MFAERRTHLVLQFEQLEVILTIPVGLGQRPKAVIR